MVLATLMVAAILVVLFSELPLPVLRRTYTVYIHFTAAPGVSVDTPVRKSGILIGRVTDVQFTEDGSVLVTADIKKDINLDRKEVPRISGSLLGGDAVIQFVMPSTGPSKQFIQHGDYIEGLVATNPLEALSDMQGNINQAISSVAVAGAEVSKVAQNLNDLLTNNDEQINRIVMKTERTLDGLQTALGGVNSVFGDEQLRNDLKRTINSLPEVMQQTRKALAGIQQTTNLADRNLRNLEGFTGPLGQRGEQMVTRIDQTVGRLDELLQQFVEFGKALNRREGSLGQLVNNPDLYQHLNAAAGNIEQLTRELKPIVRDARAFTDKIARHPELLGVRGAIKPSTGIK